MSSGLTVRGYPREGDDRAPDAFEELYGAQVRYRRRDEVTTRAGGARGAQRQIDLDGADDDILEIETSDGLVHFTTLGAARSRASSRGNTELEELVPVGRGASPISGVTRSSFDVIDPDVKAALALLRKTLDEVSPERVAKALLDPVARAAMQRVSEWIDRPCADDAPEAIRRKKAKRRGLYRIDRALRLDPDDRCEAETDDSSEPVLVLLHGTFSHTEAAFGGLREKDEWATLSTRYGDRMFALEHATLSKTPVENALDAARLLPRGSKLHLVSHSRGGLVGEALSLSHYLRESDAEFDSILARLAKSDSSTPDLEALPALRAVMTERDLSVERFARVACPARGTILASRRVDQYATYLFNAMRLLPGVPGTGVVEAIKLLLLTFLDQRADVRAVPGLEAQMPESAFIAALNTCPGPGATDHLGVIAGDVEGSGLLKRLKVLGADLFFREDHDMVVNTGAMSRGVPRLNGARLASFKGPAYSHSNYFTDPAARGALERWMTSDKPDGVPGFSEIKPEVRRGPTRGVAATQVTGTVVLVPDAFGSTLSVAGTQFWPDPVALSGAGLDTFLDHDGPWESTGLVPAYDALASMLDTHLQAFPYSPGEDLASAADRLNETIAAHAGAGPVHVIAHGAGCRILLAADAASAAPGDAHPARAPGRLGRRILLSPPLEGSALAGARAAGREALTAGLALISGEDPAAIAARLEARLGLAGAAVASQPLPEAAWGSYCAVFGRAAYTWTTGPDGELQFTDSGDGHTVLRQPPAGLSSHYRWVPFDQLVRDDGVLTLVLRLLADPAAVPPDPFPAAGAEVSPAPESFPVLFPTDADLVWASMGAPVPPEREQTVLSVRVVHGNLAGASEKLIVGTQFGTPIAGAEKALDARLDGVLARHRLLRQYPGPRGTCQLFVRPETAGPGAAVIGLGDPGDLSPGDLTAGVTQACLRLVAAQTDDDAGSLAIATVLIGTMGPGALAVPSSVNAAITGVRRANRRLSDLGLPHHVNSLTIYELYEDRAIEALTAAKRLEPDRTANEDDLLKIDPLLNEGTDRRSGSPRSDYNSDRWRTIRVSGVEPSDSADPLWALSFTETGRSAGAATQVTTAQRRIIDALVEQSVGSSSVDEQINNTLYELLVPRSMKGQGRPSENVMYMLDEHAAALPFEMLATRSFDDGVVPMAIEVGMVRRLESTRIRDLVRPSPGRKALVIGDPYLGEGEGAPQLAGAVREARAVADLLESRGWEVRALIPDDKGGRVDTQMVLNALFAHEYRIIHIAAHGRYDADHPERSGVRIGPDDYLTAAEFEQMQTTPDLVFLNCCHLGSGVGRADKLAASVSRKLIDNGIRAVVAAGWAVDDAAASRFAHTFYDHMLEGDNLGAAALQARKRIHDEFASTTNTWGAYQVYGEPAFQLERERRSTRTGDLSSRRGFREQLQAITELSTMACPESTADLVRQLNDLVRDGQRWIRGQEHQSIGEAWRALGDYDQAITAYGEAMATGGSGAGFDVIAQLSTAHAHRGADRLRCHQPDSERDFAKATELLGLWRNLASCTKESAGNAQLLMAEATVDQHRLWRLAAPGQPRDGVAEALLSAASTFRDASRAQEAVAPGGKDAQYAQLSAVILEYLAAANQPRSRTLSRKCAGWAEEIEGVKTAAEAAPWSAAPYERTRAADALLAHHVVTGTPDQSVVAETYGRIFEQGVSTRERETIVRWIELIQACLPPQFKEANERRSSLEGIRRALMPWSAPSEQRLDGR
ncbi:CHAT domain-containing protein [Nocardioides sp.]|uniref:CHAT domain-containing protein n=1 Tax=Nocardioides sp. TaxID=35761 RepID=UPI003D0E1830